MKKIRRWPIDSNSKSDGGHRFVAATSTQEGYAVGAAAVGTHAADFLAARLAEAIDAVKVATAYFFRRDPRWHGHRRG